MNIARNITVEEYYHNQTSKPTECYLSVFVECKLDVHFTKTVQIT